MIPSQALNLIKRFEGFRSTPYLCSAGVPTIGYGSTYYKDGTKVTLNDSKIDIDTATDILVYTITCSFIPSIIKLCPNICNDEPKMGAIISWTYNLGATRLKNSTLRKRILEEKWEEAGKEILKWNLNLCKPSKGLTIRRQVERDLFLS